MYTESESTKEAEELPEYSDFIVPNGNTVLERFIPQLIKLYVNKLFLDIIRGIFFLISKINKKSSSILL